MNEAELDIELEKWDRRMQDLLRSCKELEDRIHALETRLFKRETP